MFGKLKEKIGGFFKKTEKKVEKPKKIIVKKEESEISKKIGKSLAEKKKAEKVKKKSEKAKVEKEEIDKPEKVVEVSEDEVVEELAEDGGFFSKLAKRMSSSVLSKENFDEFFDEFEMTLLENNVSLAVVDKIRESLENSLVGNSFKKSEVKDKILDSLKRSIDIILLEGVDVVDKIKKSRKTPFVILFFGINGSGKTTSIAKFAWKLKKAGLDVVLAAADTFRAASIEQLKTHGEKIGVDVVAQNYGSDPAAVAFDAIQHAKKTNKQVVLIDTAGRMYTASNLMKEMEKIVRVAKPDMKIFVGESITGNDATEQAKMFNDVAEIDGVILSKADVDEKAGTILSVGYVTGKPILYLGVGQEYKDLEAFSKKRVFEGLGLD